MLRPPPVATVTYTPFPSTTLCRSNPHRTCSRQWREDMFVRYGDQEVSGVVRQTAAVMGRIRIHVSCASCFTILRRLVKNLRSRLYSAICRSVIDVSSKNERDPRASFKHMP